MNPQTRTTPYEVLINQLLPPVSNRFLLALPNHGVCRGANL